MSPNDASVYSDTWSATTWTIVLTGLVVFVSVLMVGFIVLVQRACDTVGADRTPQAAASTGTALVPAQAPGGLTGGHAARVQKRNQHRWSVTPHRRKSRDTTHVG